MLKVFKRTKSVLIFTILGILLFLACLFGAVFCIVKQEYINFIFIGIGLYLDIFFFLVVWIESKGTFEMNDDGLLFRYRVFSKSKKYNRRNVFLKYEDVRCVFKKFTNGDGFISADTTQYRFVLKDGCELEAYFFHFGKAAEQEIDALLKKYTCVIPI